MTDFDTQKIALAERFRIVMRRSWGNLGDSHLEAESHNSLAACWPWCWSSAIPAPGARTVACALTAESREPFRS